ncbi:response regulator [Gemmatimonadota bacterium]
MMNGSSESSSSKILIVDDNDAILEFMVEVFTSWGPFVTNPCDVVTATGVQNAIETLGQQTFDLIVLDMVMADGNGLQILEYLRNEGTDTPTVIISADDPPELQKKALEMGARSFLRKGDGVESLVRTALTLLDTAPSGVSRADEASFDDRREEDSGLGRILIVDDDPLVSDALGSMVNLIGNVEVRLASGGRSGLEQAREWDPHVILLDIAMPDMDGRQTLKALGDAEVKSRVIMVSSFRDSDTAQECLELGAVDYIPKPVDFPFLKRAVAGHLALARREAVT